MDVRSLTKERLSHMAAEKMVGSDAVSKSLRCYETHVHPLLVERLSIWWDELDKKSIDEGNTYTYNKAVSGMTGSYFMNFLFQSFYELEPRYNEVDIIYPRPSRKTTILLNSSNAHSMFDEIGEWLAGYERGQNSEVIELRQLSENELGRATVIDLLDNTLHSSLTQGIQSLLYENAFRFPADKYVTVKGRVIRPDLIMKVKYYPARDDNRAYCSDHSRLRSLVACCLNRMIVPKRMSTRLRLHSSRILRPDKKDVLDLALPLTAGTELHSFLLITDISNFTGSFANSWLTLYVMSLDLACGKLEDRYQLFSVGGHFVSASWKELLILYNYLTVGVPCWIESQSRFGYLSGGFLGVGGNITIGLLTLAVFLQDLLWRLLQTIPTIYAQAGGDDVAFAFNCKTDPREITMNILEELGRYVGQVKDYQLYDLTEQPDGLIIDARFCRKRIIIERTNSSLLLRGEPSVPLPKSLFPSITLHRLDLQVRAWRELDYGLLRFDAVMPGHEQLLDTLRQLYLERYPRVRPQRVHSTLSLTGSFRLIQYGSYLMTDLALTVIEKVGHVWYQDIVAVTSIESKTHHALVTELVSMVRVKFGEDHFKQVVMAKRETNLLWRERLVEEVHRGFDDRLLDELRTIVNS